MKSKLTFKESVERWYRRYILLRLRNPAFVTSWLMLLGAEICGFYSISPTTVATWGGVIPMALNLLSNPWHVITLSGTTIVSFMNPILRGAKDGDPIEDERLNKLEEKRNKKTGGISNE